MDSILRPDIVSGELKVVKVEDTDGNSAEVELVTPVTDSFIDRWGDTQKVVDAGVNHAILGMDLEVDVGNAEFHKSGNGKSGILTAQGKVSRQCEGITTDNLSNKLVPLDSNTGRIVLLDPDSEITGAKLATLFEEIQNNFPAMHKILDPEDSSFLLSDIDYFAEIRGTGINTDDLKRFLFGIRSPEMLDRISSRIVFDRRLDVSTEQGTSRLFKILGFTHETAMGVFQDTDMTRMVGSRVVFPRANHEIYEHRFLMRLQALKALLMRDQRLPLKFYDTKRRVIQGCNGSVEKILEEQAKLDLEIITSYPATAELFDIMRQCQGGRKAMFLSDGKDLQELLNGDNRFVKASRDVRKRTPVSPLARAQDSFLPEWTEVADHHGFSELQALESISEERDGVLFCKYFPNLDVLRHLHMHAGKLRAIVFEAPSYKPAESVKPENEKYDMEAHIFFGANEYVALREFHQKFPDIKLIWRHPGLKRNLIFVDDGELPMFAKPEVAMYLENKERTLRMSFCGSSTVKKGMDQEQVEGIRQQEEAFTEALCQYAKDKNLKPVGVNGGGPDVMERNGEHLQEFGAVSVSSACDLGKVGQYRHMNWDAVLNLAEDSTSFTLREEVLLCGDIVIISPGGIGSIQEILSVLAQNKLGIASKKIFLLGKAYWNSQIDQLLHAAKEGNIGSKHLALLFAVDTPEELLGILAKFDNNEEEYFNELVRKWEEDISKKT